MHEAAPHIAMPDAVAEQKRLFVNYIISGIEGVPFERLGLARTQLHPHINEFNAKIGPRTITMGRVKKDTKNNLKAEARPRPLDTGGITPAQIGARMSWESSARLRGTVVPGIGTIHAAASAGGIAANLQLLNVGLLTSSAMTTGATVGACVHTIKPIKTARSVLRNGKSVIQHAHRRLFR